MGNARAIVDIDTGEIINTAESGDRINIVRENSLNLLRSQEKWNENHFFKGYVDELRKVLPSLEQSEKSLLMSVAPYVSYFDCHLQYSNGKDITIDSIVRITGYTRKTTLKILHSLQAKDIIYHGENSANEQWFVNPWLFSRGNTINKVLKAMFKNYYIRTKKCKWKDLYE